MRLRPETSFRCSPQALHRIMLSVAPEHPRTAPIYASVSTDRGCSLAQVADVAERLGLDFRVAYRASDTAFAVPSVVHFNLDHFAAIIQQNGDLYLLQDPTFGNDLWISKATLEAETSGYFLLPAAQMGSGWRLVAADEAQTLWGKGNTGNNDPGPHGPDDPAAPDGGSCQNPGGGGGGGGNGGGGGDFQGLAVPKVHLMLVSLNIKPPSV
jgi:hypothetical protein